MIRVVVFAVIFLVTNAKYESSPQCTCPEGVVKNPPLVFCGWELKELNSNASQKVLQSNCQDQFFYACLRPKSHAGIHKKCQYSCVIPTEEIQKKYNMTEYRVSRILRWCINLSEAGRTQDKNFKFVILKMEIFYSFTEVSAAPHERDSEMELGQPEK